MRYSSRFFLYAPVALFLALAAAAVVHWWTVAGALDRKLTALKGHAVVPGVTLDWSKVTISGLPFRLDVLFDGFAVTGAGAHGPFAWHAEHFAVHALTYGTEKDVFEAAGTQHLAWTDAGGTGHVFTFLPGSLHASAVRNARGLTRFDVDIIELAGKGLSIGRAQFHMRRDPDGKSIDLMAQALLAKGDLGAFGQAVKSLRLYQKLDQGAALAPLLKGEAGAAAADAAWLRAGGTVKLTAAEWNGKKALPPPQAAAAIRLLSPLY